MENFKIKWTLYDVLKHSFSVIYTTGQLWYCLLYSGNGGMAKGNKLSLIFSFFICHSRTGSSSTCFALLKLISKDSTKQKHFCMSPFWPDLLFWNWEDYDLCHVHQSCQFVCRQGFMQKMSIKKWTVHVFLMYFFQWFTTGQLWYGLL